jgi:hypothetical protein
MPQPGSFSESKANVPRESRYEEEILDLPQSPPSEAACARETLSRDFFRFSLDIPAHVL